jgi:hypothetical protein
MTTACCARLKKVFLDDFDPGPGSVEPKIVDLKFSHDTIARVDPGVIPNKTASTILKLDWNQNYITVLPDGFFEVLTSLQSLNLNNNGFVFTLKKYCLYPLKNLILKVYSSGKHLSDTISRNPGNPGFELKSAEECDKLNQFVT